MPLEHNRDPETGLDPDAEFGGTEARKKLEKRLLRKLDARMSILIVIYILNYVSYTQQMDFRRELRYLLHADRSEQRGVSEGPFKIGTIVVDPQI
jgi:hypothetical protein